MEQTASFGYWLRRQRKALDLTQAALAGQAGCAVGTLKKIETDQRRPSRQLAERLADCLAITGTERAAFVRAARAELATDQLTVSAQPIHARRGEAPPPNEDPRSHNLPAQPNALIGREREIAEVCALLRDDDVRLLTLTGTGGTGKTRLAIQAAVERLATFADGVWFVNLAPILDPTLVTTTIARTLGLIESANTPISERVCAFVRAKRMLLLLDNFEHVLDAAPLVADLLAAAPGLKVLVTSRTTLHIYGEHEYAVPPLALPPTDDGRQTMGERKAGDSTIKLPNIPAETISQYESVRLFIVRARAAKADFALTNDNAPTVAAICHRLDGLPLAIELAAARVKLFTPEVLLARLSQPLALLIAGPRNLPARQQTLRNTIAWSYDLLDEGEQALFRRLGVFVGGWTPAAAEAIASELKIENAELRIASNDQSLLNFQFSTLNLIESLIDKSLLRQEAGADGAPRFVMLETVREYAPERLQASDELEPMRLWHATYFMTLAEQAEPALKGHQQVAWLDRLEQEFNNIRAALGWGMQSGEVETIARLSAAIWRFWHLRAHFYAGLRWLEAIIERSEHLSVRVRAKTNYAAGMLYTIDGSLEYDRRAQPFVTESLALYRTLGDRQGIANALAVLGRIEIYLWKNYTQAKALLDESLALSRALDDTFGQAWALLWLGGVATGQGDHAAQHRHYTESLMLMRKEGDQWSMAIIFMFLAWEAQSQSNYATAWELTEERLIAERALRNKVGVMAVLQNLGELAFAQGDQAAACRYGEEALVLIRELGYPIEVADILDSLGCLALAGQDYATARARFEEGLELCRDIEDSARIVRAHINLGYLAWRENNNRRAAALLEESLELSRALDDPAGEAYARYWLACLTGGQGDATRATELLKESLAMFEASQPAEGRVIFLVGFAAVVAAQGQPERAARLCGAAESLFTAEMYPLWTIYRIGMPWSTYRAEYDRTLAAIRAQLDDATFTTAWAAGRALTLDEAIAEALAGLALDATAASLVERGMDQNTASQLGNA